VVALLADYLEGRLPGERHAELTRHLDDCHGCLAQLQTYRSTVSDADQRVSARPEV